MLRAVRFAAIFGFQLEAATLAALGEMASQITVVSAERIATEMRIMLVHSARVRAVELLRETGLLKAIFPELCEQPEWNRGGRALGLLRELEQPTFPLAMAALVDGSSDAAELTDIVGGRWRLSRKEIDRLAWLTNHSRAMIAARSKPWSELQPVLVHEGAVELVALYAAKAKLGEIDPADVDFCRAATRSAGRGIGPADAAGRQRFGGNWNSARSGDRETIACDPRRPNWTGRSAIARPRSNWPSGCGGNNRHPTPPSRCDRFGTKLGPCELTLGPRTP